MFLTVVLFFYAAFFYKPPTSEEKIVKDQVTKSEDTQNILDIEEEKRLKQEEEQKLKEAQVTKKIQIKTEIEDGLYATVGNKAITKSDIVNEIKIILILNSKSYSEKEGEELRKMAIKALIKRNIKQIEIEKRDFLQFNQQDLKKEIMRLANNINLDVDTLRNIIVSNELDFSVLEDQITTELLWNSLIFQLYKNKLSINLAEIDEQLKLIGNKKEIEEYLISEIVIESVDKDKLESTIKKLKDKIKIEGFKNVAMNLSISDSAKQSGDLGWINENQISKKLKNVIANTPVGKISKPILLPDGILIFKLRNKKKVKRNLDLEKIKNELVNSEKTRILNMHSSSHYNNLRRSISIKFF
jgi:parvulin-like peptidyl-prolyl isomerase|tara:strand:+ start:405 stop:1475 length:1071 start_codon:yes stop_codon:yes gene_type:complete